MEHFKEVNQNGAAQPFQKRGKTCEAARAGNLLKSIFKMRKLKLLAVASVLFFGCTFFAQTAQAQTKHEAKYFVVVGWLNNNTDKTKSRFFVSNVVKAHCNYKVWETEVENQFSDYFSAYYKRRTGYDYANSMTVFEFGSYSEAEKQRREQIARHNDDYRNKEGAYLFLDFNHLCEDNK